MAEIVCSTSVFTAWNSLWDFCDLTQSDNSMNELHLRLLFQSDVGVGDEDSETRRLDYGLL